ncbi:MAG: mechanosensitive ion channel family protein [Candidatus Cloacimonetes bacterium]|nr:mechanosensitive ion channel family protein [Candidatus Cloacimonadota bacterium]
MSSIIETIASWLTPENLRIVIKIAIIVFIGIPLVKIIANSLGRSVGRRKSSLQSEMLIRKTIYYLGLTIIFVTLLNIFGFNISVLLGAIGIFGVALGFASQTSVSNIISGIFLITEKPIEIGDVVQIGTTVGIVLSVDLLSVKLRTFDNRFVRIPNESIIKTEMVNITRFPIRRLDLDIGVAYKEDIARVISILKDLAAKNPYCLEEPEPMIFLNNFGNSSIDIRFALWFEKKDLINLRSSIMLAIKERFDAEGIEIPFPHITVYTGEEAKPYPIKLTEGDKSSKPS